MNNPPLAIGDPLPRFANLKGIDGKKYSSDELTDPILVLVFSCNHCPYVQAYEERMKSFQGNYAARGVRLLAINSNEIQNYPDDSFEKMVERSKMRGFNFLYVRDEDQSVAESFGATHTPQFFIFDTKRTLRYSGKMDDNWKEPDLVKEFYLRDAVESLLAGKEIKIPETYSIGCTIKWK
jgi:glutathione peroxidase-family protein